MKELMEYELDYKALLEHASQLTIEELVTDIFEKIEAKRKTFGHGYNHDTDYTFEIDPVLLGDIETWFPTVLTRSTSLRTQDGHMFFFSYRYYCTLLGYRLTGITVRFAPRGTASRDMLSFIMSS